MQLFEVILIEIGEKSGAADWVFRYFKIVNVTIPVFANVVCRCGRRRGHNRYYKIKRVYPLCERVT